MELVERKNSQTGKLYKVLLVDRSELIKKVTLFSIYHSNRRPDMWQTKEFKTKEAMQKFIDNSKHKRQVEIIYINNGYAVEFRKLKIIEFKETKI